MYTVDIKTVSAVNAIGVEHIGSYMQIGKAFDTLFGWLGARGKERSGHEVDRTVL